MSKVSRIWLKRMNPLRAPEVKLMLKTKMTMNRIVAGRISERR